MPWPVPGTGKGRKADLSSLKIDSYRNLLLDPGSPKQQRSLGRTRVCDTKPRYMQTGEGKGTAGTKQSSLPGWTASRICLAGREDDEICFRVPRALVLCIKPRQPKSLAWRSTVVKAT